MLKAGNLLSGLSSGPLADETVETLCEGEGVRIERIVSTGQATPQGQWYDQKADEWVMVVKGRARLRIEDEVQDRELGEGDFILLPAHCRHRVTWTEEDKPTVWLTIHFSATGSRQKQ
jgi:cupin 2 domain-containing protein